jgi:hypothetical protein
MAALEYHGECNSGTLAPSVPHSERNADADWNGLNVRDLDSEHVAILWREGLHNA